MRRKLVRFFCAGYICGLVTLALLLWVSGRSRTIRVSAAPAGPPELRRAMPSHAPQPESSPATGASHADRPVMAHRLIIPVEGIRAANLQDHFNELHSGHRHEALDIMAARGTPVLAAGAGRVAKLFLSKAGGLTVYQFDDSQTYCYYYAHLDRYAPGLKEGALLRQGEVLAYVGSTGNASPNAPHLHFAIFKLGPDKHWWQGDAIDPYPVLIDSAGG